MRILRRYVRDGAPMSISLSSACRAEVLMSEASSPLIFARARQEIMEKMGGGAVTYRVSRQQHRHSLRPSALSLRP